MEFGFSLGSNRGDRVAMMSQAKRRLLDVSGVQWVAQSPLYETEPVDVLPEYADLTFVNAVLVLAADWTPEQWGPVLHAVEADMGRVRGGDRNAPRTIDVDLIYADDACMDSGGLIVPHPRWAQRRFVVQPLADVRPDLILPGAGKTVSEILRDLSGEAVSRLNIKW